MKLLIETTEELEYLKEAADANSKGSYFIKGPFMQAETKNKNGRVYPLSVLSKEVARYQGQIGDKRSMGELGHPAVPSVNLDRVSHLITDLHMEGNNAMGKAKILDTPTGKIAKNLMDEGIKLGVSSRGLGTLSSANGYQLVNDDFYLATVDIVADPSAPEAFVANLRESKEWIMESGVWYEADLVKAQKKLNVVSRADYEKMALDVFNQFLGKL